MSQSVHHAAGEERLRAQVDSDHDDSRDSEQDQGRGRKQHDPEIREAAVEVALDPVVRRALAIILQNGRVLRGDVVELVAFEEDAFHAEDDRAMRIAKLVGVDVMAPVNGNPFFRDRTGAVPEPESEQVP
jgi:hypothetical protein